MPLFSRQASRIFPFPAAMAVLIAGVLVLDACGDSTSPWPSRGPVDSVVVAVNPPSDSIVNRPAGQTRQLIAAPIDAQGILVDSPVTWSSSDNDVATVNASGIVTYVGPGTATISASAGGRTGTIEVGTRWPAASVTVLPENPSIRMEGAVQMTAELRDVEGRLLPGREDEVQWTSSNEAVATVSETGVVSGWTEGVTTITATSEGASGSTQLTVAGQPVVATVTVTPGNPFVGTGQILQMTATARAGSGTVITGGDVTWASSNETVATVDETGLVTVHARGKADITATVEGVTGASTLDAVSTLVNGQPQTAPTIAPNESWYWAVIVPPGLTEFTVEFTGADSGDPDLYIYPPGGSNIVCASFNDGPVERCTIPTASHSITPGTYRIRAHAWSGGGTVTGLTAVVTHP